MDEKIVVEVNAETNEVVSRLMSDAELTNFEMLKTEQEEFEASKLALEQKRASDYESAVSKLSNLGLTPDEIEALLR